MVTLQAFLWSQKLELDTKLMCYVKVLLKRFHLGGDTTGFQRVELPSKKNSIKRKLGGGGYFWFVFRHYWIIILWEMAVFRTKAEQFSQSDWNTSAMGGFDTSLQYQVSRGSTAEGVSNGPWRNKISLPTQKLELHFFLQKKQSPTFKYRPATYRAVSPFSALSRHHSRLGGS